MMRYLIYILFGCLLACSGIKEGNSNYYSDNSVQNVHSLLDLIVQHNNNEYTDLNKVKKIVVDLEKIEYNRLTNLAFQILQECVAVEYILIKYPTGELENDFSEQFLNAFSGINNLRQLHIDLDSASHIPALFNGNIQFQKVTIFGNYIEDISGNAEIPNSLKALDINCVTNRFNFDWNDFNELESLTLNIRGKIEGFDFSALEELKYLHFYNDQIEVLPVEFFQLPKLESLVISTPKLRSMDESIGALKLLESFSFATYEMDKLPESFSHLSCLKWLSISMTERITSLNPITKLPQLKSLSIQGINPIHVVDDILLIKKLNTLEISLMPLQNQDLSSLKKLERLREIQFTTSYVEKNVVTVKYKDLSEDKVNKILDELREVLPKHFSKN